MKQFLISLLLFVAPGLLCAASGRIEQDLGQGLAYCRVHSLPADLPGETAAKSVVVLDLRFSRGDDGAATALGTWLKARSKLGTPVFVLVNDETSPAALAYLSAHDPGPGLITLSPQASRLEADVTLKTSAATDRAAYEAFEHGTPLATLLVDPTPKPRHDEASIAQEHSGAALEVDSSDPADSVDEAPPAPAIPPPVVDYVLLRAVHLHRTLLALRNA